MILSGDRSLDAQTLGRELRAVGYRKLTARPRHHAQDADAIPAQRLGADRHRELVPDPLPKIDQAPTHDAVCRGDWATLDSSRQRRPRRRTIPRCR